MSLDHLVVSVIGFFENHRNRHARRLAKTKLVRHLVVTGKLTPNRLTFLRVIIAVVLITFVLTSLYFYGNLDFLFQTRLFIFGMLFVAALTDAFDGPLAREYQAIIPPEDALRGINYDRHADKLLTLPILAIYFPLFDAWTMILVGATIGGDLLATALAVLVKKIGRPIPSNQLGKAKMATLCLSLTALTLGYPRYLAPFQFLLVASTTLGITSLAVNVRTFLQRHANRQAKVVGMYR